MKFVTATAVFFAIFLTAVFAEAQTYCTVYYTPSQVVAAPTVVHYAPAPAVTVRRVRVARPAPLVVPPAVPATTYYVPYVPARPVSVFYSPYGGSEVRVSGQPVRNLIRTIVP